MPLGGASADALLRATQDLLSPVNVLIVDTYYPAFLASLYARLPELGRASYAEQWRRLMDQCFGTADFYSMNLSRLGHEATEVVVNARELQMQWARERGFRLPLALRWWKRRGVPIPWVSRDWFHSVLLAQIRSLQPDVIHFQDPNAIDPAFLRELRPYVRRITAQIASPIPPRADFSGYDLVFSSLPHFVETFRRAGLRSEVLGLGFEPSLLGRIPHGEPRDIVFVGGLSRAHADRIELLETLAERRPFEWWGYGAERLPPRSPLRRGYRGPAWGLEMYERLRTARITLNVHIGVAGRYANNMRLYEATGVGSLLLTDWKENLGELFEPGREVAAFRSAGECVELIDHYLSHEEERAAVARAGQVRTLRDHTYERRMGEYAERLRGIL